MTKALGLREAHRPCTLCEHYKEYCARVQKYLEAAAGTKPQMVYLLEVCLLLDCHKETLENWVNKKRLDGSSEHPEFFDLVKKVERLQELRLQQRMLGKFNPTGAIFLLKTKHGYIEQEKRIITGDKNEPLEITIIEDSKARYDDKNS